MVEKKTLGVYIGHDQLYCVLTAVDKKPLKIFTVDLSKDRAVEDSQNKSKFNVEDLSIGQLLQDALKENDLSVYSIQLSISPRDTVFRTFVIPWVQASEVKSLVEFEAAKYLPFSLDELSFAFHASSFNENNLKRLRILFVAIKKATLENYVDKIEQTGLIVDIIEPSPSSLMRTLVARQLLNVEGTVAVITKSGDSGKVSIVNQTMPYFVREFQLGSKDHSQSDGSTDQKVMRLINEIRISCDYFNRQNGPISVNEALLIAGEESDKLSGILKDDLGIPVLPIPYEKLMDDTGVNHNGFLFAYGVSIVDSGALPANLFLYEKRARSGGQISTVSGFNAKVVVFTAVVCAIIVGTAFMFINKSNGPFQTKIRALKSGLGNRAKQKITEIIQETRAKKTKIEDLKNIRFKSDMAELLAVFPELLPQGAWLKNLELAYPEIKTLETPAKNSKKKISKTKKNEKANSTGSSQTVENKYPNIVIEGYVYLDNINEQFGLVNSFLSRIKSHAVFTGKYQKITLDTLKTEKMDAFEVTYFKIICLEK